MITFRLWRFCAIGLLAILFGCGSAGPKIAPAKGKVTYKNTPLKFGAIMFRTDTGKVASSSINPDGTFELGTNKPGDGAIVGKHRVRVVCTTTQDPKYLTKTGQEMPVGNSLIPEIYADFDTTPLKDYEVQDIPENVFNIELKD